MSKISRFFQAVAEASYPKLWLLFFLGTAAVALFVQLLALPFLLPQMHAGHGLLAGGDMLGFHETAVRMAALIREEGWSAWKLRPEGNAPPGIAAAIYAITVAEPYALIPLNAALHATAGIVMILMLEAIIGHRQASFWAALPLLVFPSAASWYAQIHKDGFYIAGILLVLYGWVLSFDEKRWSGAFTRLAAPLALIFCGGLLVWIVRPYAVQFLQTISSVFAVFGIVLLLLRILTKKFPVRRAWIVLVFFLLMPLVITPLRTVDWIGNFSTTESLITGDVQTKVETTRVSTPYAGGGLASQRWQRTFWVPAYLDKIMLSVAHARDGLLHAAYSHAKSTIDKDFQPSNATEFLTYLPRALQIGYLAPFPVHWLGQGSIEAGTMMRRLVSVEMIVIYVAVALLPFAVLALRRRIAFWLVLGFCTAFLVLYAYAIPNLGTMYRMRYVFIMTFVSLSLGGAIKYFGIDKNSRPTQKEVTT